MLAKIVYTKHHQQRKEIENTHKGNINKNQKYKNLEKVQILLLELRQKLTELNKNMRNTNKNDRKPHHGCH